LDKIWGKKSFEGHWRGWKHRM